MRYCKVLLIIGLSLLLSHCGDKSGIAQLSEDLKKASCVAGVHTGEGDVNSGIIASTFLQDDAELKITINHNRKNNDPKVIFLVEEIVQPAEEGASESEEPKKSSMFCSTYSNLEYTKAEDEDSLSKLMFSAGISAGMIGTVGSVSKEINFKEEGEGCTLMGVDLLVGNEFSEEEDSTGELKLQEIKETAPSFSALEKKCAKIAAEAAAAKAEKEKEDAA